MTFNTIFTYTFFTTAVFMVYNGFSTITQLFGTLFEIPYFLVGFLLYVSVYFAFLTNKSEFITTLDHELSHAIFAVFTGVKVEEMLVTSHRGGHVKLYGHNHFSTLILIAPYFLRLYFPVVVFLLFLTDGTHIQSGWLYYMIAGMGFGYHVGCVLNEAHPDQTDLQHIGLSIAYPLLICLNLIWLALMIAGFLPNHTISQTFKNMIVFW